MTREEAKQLLPVIQAFIDGKTIQSRTNNSSPWRDDGPTFNWTLGADNYRVKPREFWIALRNDGERPSIFIEEPYPTPQMKEIIHVLEVL